MQYRLWLVPNYSEKESAIIIKVHHCMADGLGFAAFMLALSDSYDVDNLPHLKPLSPFRQALVYLALPFMFAPQALNILGKKMDLNELHNQRPISGEKKGAFTRDIDIGKIK